MEQKSFPWVLWTKIWFSVYSSIRNILAQSKWSVNSLNQDTLDEMVKKKKKKLESICAPLYTYSCSAPELWDS